MPKPGSPLVDGNLYANYDATCAIPVKCNKPNWVKDALGNETDYAYDPTHGGVLTVTLPADLNGIRPQTRYTYNTTLCLGAERLRCLCAIGSTDLGAGDRELLPHERLYGTG